MNIEEFAQSTLRQDQEQHITGNWRVNKLIIDGDFNGTINGFNFKDDVLHTGNWEKAEVTGFKKIKSLDVYDVKARIVNGIDISDWFQNAVNLNSSEEQIVDGTIELHQAVFYDDLQVFGTVNGIDFSPETVLTKSGDGQVITGDLTIRVMTPQEMKQLLIENLYLRDGINGRNLTELYMNTLKASDTKIDSERLIFEQKLVAESIQADKTIFGVDMAAFLKGSDASNELVRFQSNLRYLARVGESLKASADDVAVVLDHFEYHQSIHGVNIQKTVPLAIEVGPSVDHVLAVHERNTNTSFEVVKFHRWSREQHNFIDDASILPLQYGIDSYQITKLSLVVYNGADHLFVEIFDKTSKAFFQSLMRFDPASQAFVAVLQSQSPFSAQFFTLDNGGSSCYGSIFPSFGDINIICDGSQSTVLKTAPIRMVSSQNGIIILLTDDHQLQIWYQQKIQQVLKVMNPQSFTSARFDGKFFIAVSSDKVDQSTHHGSMEIFESGDDINFVHVQSFDLQNPFMAQFSVIASGDLMLYVLTRNPGHALNVYQYAGVSYFVESIENPTIINAGRDLSTMKVDGTELIAVVSDEVFIIQVVLKEF